jgi:hypothetical protein
VPTALDNDRRSPKKLLPAVVVRLLGRNPIEVMREGLYV